MKMKAAEYAADPTSLLTRPQVAEMLGVSVRTVDNWLADGTLPVFRFGRSVRIRPEDLKQFATQRYTGDLTKEPMRAP